MEQTSFMLGTFNSEVLNLYSRNKELLQVHKHQNTNQKTLNNKAYISECKYAVHGGGGDKEEWHRIRNEDCNG